VASVCLVGLDHLGKARSRAQVQHVRQQQSERLVADDLARAPYRMTEPVRGLLTGEAGLPRPRQLRHQLLELSPLAPVSQRALQLVLAVEVVLDGPLVAAGDEDEVLD